MAKVKRLCRLCLKNETNRIFTEILENKSDIDLQIFLFIGIEVKPISNFPLLICDDCLRFLHEVHQFRLKCLESDKYFKEILKETVEVSVEVYLEEDAEQHTNEVRVINEDVLKKNKEGSEIDLYTSSTDSTMRLKMKPEERRKKKTNRRISTVIIQRTETTKKGKTKTRYRPMCTFCGKEQESEYRLIQHELLAHTQLSQMSPDDVFVCDLCARIFKTKQSMRNHVIRAHTPSTERFPCSVCGKVLPHLKALYAHERVHIKSEVTCQYCAKTFDRKVLLSSHIAIVHLKKRLTQCQYCPHQAITGGALKKHIRCKHLNLREHHCDWPDCGKSFHENQHLVRHIRSHTQERPFECRNEGCKKAFSDHAKRSRHEKQNCPGRNT